MADHSVARHCVTRVTGLSFWCVKNDNRKFSSNVDLFTNKTSSIQGEVFSCINLKKFIKTQKHFPWNDFENIIEQTINTDNGVWFVSANKFTAFGNSDKWDSRYER